jgi:peptidoglycan hydrolase-like protein with peptidoglycan-binding domain
MSSRLFLTPYSVLLFSTLLLFVFSVATAQLRPSYYDASSIPSASERVLYEQQPQPTTNATGCALFTQTLYWGLTDAETKGEVTKLRAFLGLKNPTDKDDVGVYTEEVELAVRAYQKRNGIVTPGLSCKTGYGIVEKKTRDYINAKNDCTPVVPRKTVSCAGVAQCPLLRTNITRGTVDAEGVRGVVSTLQCALRSAGVYTGPINGVFGSATEAAVRSFQTTRKLGVSGAVNAQTREAISQCAVGQAVEQGGGRKAKSAHYTLRIDPARGQGPLTVTMSFAFNGSTCSSYELGWGDGTLADSYDAGRPATCSPKPVTQTYTHTYTQPGTYDISVRQGEDALSRLPVSNSAQVIVE